MMVFRACYDAGLFDFVPHANDGAVNRVDRDDADFLDVEGDGAPPGKKARNLDLMIDELAWLENPWESASP